MVYVYDKDNINKILRQYKIYIDTNFNLWDVDYGTKEMLMTNTLYKTPPTQEYDFTEIPTFDEVDESMKNMELMILDLHSVIIMGGFDV